MTAHVRKALQASLQDVQERLAQIRKEEVQRARQFDELKIKEAKAREHTSQVVTELKGQETDLLEAMYGKGRIWDGFYSVTGPADADWNLQ